MCSPEVIAQVAARMSPADSASAGVARSQSSTSRQTHSKRCFSNVIDLTHPLTEDFPTATGDQWLELEDFLTWASNRINFKIWHVHEHVGTHIDAPIHFSENGQTVEQISVESLVVPLAVIDIRARAEDNPDTELTPEDILAWESRHGRLPEGCCMAVNSGWDRHVTGERFRNADEDGVMHFPGVHVDTAQMLIEERDVVGLAIDTISIDHGPTTDYSTHYKWLPAGRWAIENLANLSSPDYS